MASVAKNAGVSRQGVYLHFADRSTLLVALVDHIDVSLGRENIRAYIHDESATGVDRLRRWVETMAWYTEKIDRVTAVLESGADEDAALAAAWRDRMSGRRDHLRRIMTKIDEEGALADGWTVDDAVSLAHAVTMPSPWRELRKISGWGVEQYQDHLWRLLAHGLLYNDSAT